MASIASNINACGELCLICSENVGDNGKAVCCDFCKKWYHLPCTDLDQKAYNLLSNTKYSSIIWKCAKCPSLESLLKVESISNLNSLEKLINDRLDNIETNISKKINLAYKVKVSASNNEKTVTSNAAVGVDNSIDPTFTEAELIEETDTAQSTPVSLHDKNSGTENSNPIPLQICSYYMVGECRHGASGKNPVNNMICKFLHPKRCKLFCKFGRDGCSGSCGFLHPVLCQSSVKYRSCTDSACTLTHLLGTERRNYKTHDGHRRYKVTWSKDKILDNFNHPNGNYRQPPWPRSYKDTVSRYRKPYNDHTNFVHNKNDFPPLQGTSDSKLNEMTTAMLEMKSCLEQFVQHAAPKQMTYTAAHSQQPIMTHPNAFWDNGAMEQQHSGSNHLHRPNIEAKNFTMPNQGYTH